MEKKYTLPKEFAEKWVAKTRDYSGDRCLSRLYDNGCYCILGLAGCVLGIPNDVMYSQADFHCMDKYKKVIPAELMKPVYFQSSLTWKLTHMSDAGVPFSEIADYIEQNCQFI